MYLYKIHFHDIIFAKIPSSCVILHNRILLFLIKVRRFCLGNIYFIVQSINILFNENMNEKFFYKSS